MLGWQRAVKYSLKPCLVGLCGSSRARQVLSEYQNHNLVADKETVLSVLKDIRSAYAYYVLIARANNIEDVFDGRVVEAYWLGNDLLKKVKASDLKYMVIEKLFPTRRVRNDLARHRLDSLIQTIKSPVFAHHSFHVFFIGAVSAKLNIELKDKCKISWGRVVEIGRLDRGGKVKLRVETICFFRHEDYALVETTEAAVGLAQQLRLGDWVSYHWGEVVEKINSYQLKNLIYYTLINYQAFKLYAQEQ